MSEIVFNGVSKAYDGNSVIAALDLAVCEGELMVLVGPSGCGKSTLLRMVAGLEEISAGEISVGGRVVNRLPPQQRNLAMVFQNYALYPHMTVRQNLAFPLKMRRLPHNDMRRKVEETAHLLDLTPLLERLPKQLSGGQRQRVAMGRAIVRDADAFLMDEPLSNLDAKLRSQIRGEIAALQGRLGITTLYVTHDQVEAMTLGQRVAILRDGRLQQVAKPSVVYRHPANIFVAGFIGNPGMNLIRAVLIQSNGGLAISLGSTALPLPMDIVERHSGIDGWCGRELLVGIRPEAISLAGADTPNLITAVVRNIESLGHETIVYADSDLTTIADDRDPSVNRQTAKPPLSAVLSGHYPLMPGDSLGLHMTLDDLCLFDLDGEAIGFITNASQKR